MLFKKEKYKYNKWYHVVENKIISKVFDIYIYI